MPSFILKKYSIPVITHTGTSYLDFYYTARVVVPNPDLVGTFNVSSSLPTTAPTGSSLVGYKLKIDSIDVAYFKEGPLYSQTAIGYSNPNIDANIKTTMQQYENKIVVSQVDIHTFYNAVSRAIFQAKSVYFEAIYQTIKINLNGTPTDGIKKVFFNQYDCDVFRYYTGTGYNNLFSKSSVTLKYVSKVNLPTSGGLPTCTIQTVTGMNNVLMPNYKINKHVFPTSIPYSSSIDGIFEREEPDEIYNWKDQVCLPYNVARSTVMTIPQKSKYIKSLNAFKVTSSSGSGTSEENLGQIKKMIEFDEAVLSQDLGYRKFYTTGGEYSNWYYDATFIRFYMLLKNTADFSDNHGIVWSFTVRDMNVSSGWVVVKIKNGSTVIASTAPFIIVNNQTYSGILKGIKGYTSISFTVEPDEDVGSETKLAFCPFYIEKQGDQQQYD